MSHGHTTRAPARNAFVERALARASGTWGGYQAWRPLQPDERLELVEKALSCIANDCTDDFPLAH